MCRLHPSLDCIVAGGPLERMREVEAAAMAGTAGEQPVDSADFKLKGTYVRCAGCILALVAWQDQGAGRLGAVGSESSLSGQHGW